LDAPLIWPFIGYLAPPDERRRRGIMPNLIMRGEKGRGDEDIFL